MKPGNYPFSWREKRVKVIGRRTEIMSGNGRGGRSQQLESVKARLSESAPDRDRLAPLAAQLGWLRDTGFRSVDYIWHFWMEHFIIARK